MIPNHTILVKCKHGNTDNEAKGCSTCNGSGYVKVISGDDGKAKECEHANTDGRLKGCPSCNASGWAGLIR